MFICKLQGIVGEPNVRETATKRFATSLVMCVELPC